MFMYIHRESKKTKTINYLNYIFHIFIAEPRLTVKKILKPPKSVLVECPNLWINQDYPKVLFNTQVWSQLKNACRILYASFKKTVVTKFFVCIYPSFYTHIKNIIGNIHQQMIFCLMCNTLVFLVSYYSFNCS